jgi:hypothetical protein
MLTEIAIFCLGVSVQMAVVFGWSYLMYGYFRRHSLHLEKVRQMTRLFGGLAAVFTFFVLTILQIAKPESWVFPLIAPIWVITIFVAHDFALGRVIKKTEIE